MPAYEDSCELEIGSLEARPTSGQDPQARDAYPFPVLVRTGTPGKVSTPLIVLENQYLKVSFAPELGGRILQMFDKRSGKDALPSVTLIEDGRRGLRLDGGIELSLDGRERLNSLGPVEFQVLEDEDLGESALLLGELSSGTCLSWHLRASLAADRAELLVEVKVFNRERLPVPYRGGLLIPSRSGVLISAEPGVFEGGLFRHASLKSLSPRQVDNWTCRVTPTQLPGGCFQGDAVGQLDKSNLRLEAIGPMIGSKIVLLVGGKTLEAGADLYPERITEFDLTGFEKPLESVAILDAAKRERFRWDLAEPEVASLEYEASVTSGEPAGFQRELMKADQRGAACVGLAMGAFTNGHPAQALEHLDDSFLYNGEDHLAWWLKAAILRKTGATGEGQELLNAHFLAPFEPMLRAESFLAGDHASHDPSPLVRPMADDPDAMIEVAALLHEAGFLDDLARWVDECLRHREIPALRYIIADALLHNSRMAVEAARHIAMAKDKPIAPPYPWRRVELGVLRRLARAFPNDERIADLLSLSSWRLPKD